MSEKQNAGAGKARGAPPSPGLPPLATDLAMVEAGSASPDASTVPPQSNPMKPAQRCIGTFIGRYKIVQLIGEGGFGTVYAADQEHPVRRRVAVKVLKLGMDTREIVARFEAERQALAMMDHPNIAKVLDGGTTDTGSPYFVMELVKGIPITQYCDASRLNVRQRLELFISVCNAVQHAHQKGIIHRDLKPSNVLIALHDGKPIPKVIDFGIAKALHGRLTDKTVVTDFHHPIGTPQYMSPEQADVNELDVDTRSDVYSLGVLLYELLTGTTPLDIKAYHKAAYAQLQQMICNSDPPKPSTRLVSLAKAADKVAEARSADSPILASTIRGDLDWIAMRCLEKDRTRRYETANALALDVQHHLADEPVAAGPPSQRYRLKKFVKRNRVVVGASAAVVIALILGAGLATTGLMREARERRYAEHAKGEAEAVNTFLQRAFASMNATPSGSRDEPVSNLLARSCERLDGGALADQPSVEAAVRTTIGLIYRDRGMRREALPQLRRAMDLRRQTADSDPHVIAQSMTNLALLLEDLHEYSKAEGLYIEAISVERRSAGNRERELATMLNSFGRTLNKEEKYSAALPILRESADLQRRLASKPDGALAATLTNLAVSEDCQGDHNAAALAFVEALNTMKTLPDFDDSLQKAVSLAGYAECERASGNNVHAAELIHESLRITHNRKESPIVGLASFDRLCRALRAGGMPAIAEQLELQWRDAKSGVQGVAATMIDLPPPASPGDGKKFLISKFTFAYSDPNPEFPKVGDLLKVPISLGLTEDGFVLPEFLQSKWIRPRTGRLPPMRVVRLERPSDMQSYYTSAIWSICTEVVDYLNSQGVNGILVYPDEKQLRESPEGGIDLRRGGDTTLRLIIRWATPLARERFFTNQHLSEGHFDEAISGLERIIRLDPSDHQTWYQLGCLLAYRNDVDGYRRTCGRMLEQFGNTEKREIADRTAKCCLLMPGILDTNTPLSLVERAFDNDSGHAYRPWFRLTYAIGQYRAGRFAEAHEWAAKARTQIVGAAGETSADFVDAMARFRLGEASEAVALFERADLIVAKSVPLTGNVIGENDLICHVLRREAASLFENQTAPGQDPTSRPKSHSIKETVPSTSVPPQPG